MPLCFPGGDDQLSVEFRVARETQLLGVHAQPIALLDAGEHLEIVDNDLFVSSPDSSSTSRVASAGNSAGGRGRAELAFERGRQFLGLVADDVVEAVVPEAENLHELRLSFVPRLDQSPWSGRECPGCDRHRRG